MPPSSRLLIELECVGFFFSSSVCLIGHSSDYLITQVHVRLQLYVSTIINTLIVYPQRDAKQKAGVGTTKLNDVHQAVLDRLRKQSTNILLSLSLARRGTCGLIALIQIKVKKGEVDSTRRTSNGFSEREKRRRSEEHNERERNATQWHENISHDAILFISLNSKSLRLFFLLGIGWDFCTYFSSLSTC